MKFDTIDSTELLMHNKEFIRLANFIYKFLKQELNSFSEKQIKSFTVLLANFELTTYKDSTEEELIYRLKEYIDRVNEDAQYLSNLDDEFDLWLNFLITATSSLGPDQSVNIDDMEVAEGQYEKYVEIINASGIFQIEKVIWKLKEPALAHVLLREILHLIYTDPNCNLISLISNISMLQKGITPVVKLLIAAFKAKQVNPDDKEQCRQFILEHRNFVVQSSRKMFSGIFQPSKALRNIKELYMKQLRSFDQRFRQRRALKRGVKKAKAAGRSKEKRDMLYSMLHSHSPIENIKIPEVIAANCQIKREAKRLAALGMTVAEGCDKAVINSPGDNNFRGLVTRVPKEKSLKIT